VRQAAQATVPCDWGIDMSAGPATQLPHLSRAKAVAVALLFRLPWELQHGQQDAARDDVLATFTLARNVPRDGTLIGVLVQQAVEAIVYANVAGHFGEFSATTLKQLEDGFDAAPARISLAATVAMELTNGPIFWERTIQELQAANPGDDAKVMDEIRAHVDHHDFLYNVSVEDWNTNLWEEIVTASGGTSEGVVRLFREIEPLYPRLAEIMSHPEAAYEQQSKQFDAEIKKSQNPLIPVLFPNAMHSRSRECRTQAWETMFRAAAEYKLHGEAGLKTVLDPFGNGPFAFHRFVFEGVDRGFELKSAYAGLGFPCKIIFVEKNGTPFSVEGPYAGKAIK
jgi:hypothetical protein